MEAPGSNVVIRDEVDHQSITKRSDRMWHGRTTVTAWKRTGQSEQSSIQHAITFNNLTFRVSAWQQLRVTLLIIAFVSYIHIKLKYRSSREHTLLDYFIFIKLRKNLNWDVLPSRHPNQWISCPWALAFTLLRNCSLIKKYILPKPNKSVSSFHFTEFLMKKKEATSNRRVLL